MVVVSDLRTDARVLKEARSLARAGHTVTLIGCRIDGGRREARTEHGVRIIRVPVADRGNRIYKRAGGAIRTVLVAARYSLFDDFDVLHCHNLHALPSLALGAVLRRRYLVYDAHEVVDDAARYPKAAIALLSLAEKGACALARVVITTNELRAGRLRDAYGVEPVVLMNCPVVENIPPRNLRRHLGLEADDIILLYQGGFYVADRPFDLVMKSVAGHSNRHFVLIGFGSPAAVTWLHDCAVELGVERQVHVLPSVPYDELLSYTAAADIGIVPLNARGLGNILGDTNKLFEYLASGLPVVASDLPEIRRVVQGDGAGPVGALFQDSKSLSDALDEVLANYEALKRRTRPLAERRYSWQIEEQKLLDVYAGM